MHRKPDSRRILLIDDNPAIHRDFRKIFSRPTASETALSDSEAALFGPVRAARARADFQIDSAHQGDEGIERVRNALQQKHPYSMAFVDVRMPPGCDGIETITRLWEVDPDVQIVICTAHSDYSWEETLEKLGRADCFIVLKKPFDSIEVLQLAEALTEKWRLARQERHRLQHLEHQILERSRDLQVARNINAQLDAANQRLVAPTESVDDTQVRRAHSLESDLRTALQTGQLCVHYQPIVEIATRRVSSLEALARWEHPSLGSISPAEFIPIAEETGLIVPLGEYVLRTVCAQVMQWQREQVPVVRVAVNVSSLQLQGPRPIWEFIRDILRETGMQPQQLALEITETTLVKNAKEQAVALQHLRDDGVHIEIDDFGTGYSSLSYLRQLPVDTIKIDRSFISQVDTSNSDESIVSAILALAHGLGLEVVAEGVETAEQLQVLARHGCEFAQGYYFSRPLPPDKCRALLVELAQRTSFTDTLRIRIKGPLTEAGAQASTLAAVADPPGCTVKTGDAQ
jgi:EAL domain-containing protein (putative c-di-GMP-specific phosphodiesterase class I)/CheY-like chemotaxis protein